MGEIEIRTHISADTLTNNYTTGFSDKNVLVNNLRFKQCHRSKLTLFKNLNTSKTSIENELIYSKKITDITSRYKTEEITFENLKPDIVCYHIETPNDKHDQDADDTNKKINTKRKAKKSSKRVKENDSFILNPHQHYFFLDDPDPTHKESVHAVESNISKEPIKWKASRTRLLHSKLRPDTSNTSNMVLPDIKYTLSSEKLRKPKYPKHIPPPAFKQVGTYKCKIPIMTSKERLQQRKKLKIEQERLEKLKKQESKELQQRKFLKKKENTRYDILFGKGNLEEIKKDDDEDDTELLNSHHAVKSTTKRLLKRLRKGPKSESEIGIIVIEPPQPETKPSPFNLHIEDDDEDDDDDDDSEIDEPEDEPEEEAAEEELEQEPEQELEPEEGPEQDLKRELELALEQQLDKEDEHEPEGGLEEEEKLEYHEEPLIDDHTKAAEVKNKTEKQSCVDECTEQCSYKPPSDDNMKAGIKPRSNKHSVIFKECDNQLCVYDQGPESRSSQRCSNYHNLIEIKTVTGRNPSRQPNYVIQDRRNSSGNRSEIVEKEFEAIFRNSYRNGSKSSQRNRRTRSIKKCDYDSNEVLFEKELQNYDYLTDRVSQHNQNLKATDHNLLLDLNFPNKVTQTYHSPMKEKDIQTRNYFPNNKHQSVPRRNEKPSNYNNFSKNALQISNGRDFKIIHRTPVVVPQLLIINHPTRCQSHLRKPTIDIIYKNSKYSYPKYVKTIIPLENSQKISVNNGKYSYNNNNFQYPSNNKNSKMFTYIVNVPQKPNDNLQHSLNIRTVERNLIVKFV